MKIINYLMGFVILYVPFISINSQTSGSWNIEIDKENIIVSTRIIEGSNLKEFKAETIIKTTKEKVISVLTDFQSYPSIFHNYKQTKLLKQISPKEYYYYVEMEAPWPVSNRDMVIHFDLTNEENGITRIKLKNVPKLVSEKKDIVRIPYFKGEWLLIPIENTGIKIVSQVHASTGGSIPAWLANQTMTKSPFISFKNLRNRLTNLN